MTEIPNGITATSNTIQPKDNILSTLSKREQEVAQYVTEGMSNQEMARQDVCKFTYS